MTMEAKPTKKERRMTRDQLLISMVKELKTDVQLWRTELKTDIRSLDEKIDGVVEKQHAQGKEIDHLKWKSGIISAIAGFLSGFSGKIFQ